MVAVVPASASVWQEPQAGEAPLVKSVLPSGAAPPPPAAAAGLLAAAAGRLRCCSSSHLSNSPGADHVGALAHHRVAEAAQLGADDGEGRRSWSA